MQTWSERRSQNAPHQDFNKIILSTLICFALAGLISGFAIGGFTFHNANKATTKTNTPVTQKPQITPTLVASATAAPEQVELGLPVIDTGDYSFAEQADGATSYTLAALIVNKSNNTPIQATNVTCRLWLTKSTKDTQNGLSANGYALPKAPGSFQQPFPAELPGVLHFTAGQQVQPCAAQKKTTWTYTLAPTVKAGTYYLAVIADWQGKHYNWYMVAITVQ